MDGRRTRVVKKIQGWSQVLDLTADQREEYSVEPDSRSAVRHVATCRLDLPGGARIHRVSKRPGARKYERAMISPIIANGKQSFECNRAGWVA